MSSQLLHHIFVPPLIFTPSAIILSFLNLYIEWSPHLRIYIIVNSIDYMRTYQRGLIGELVGGEEWCKSKRCVEGDSAERETDSMNPTSWKTKNWGNLTTSNAGSFVHTSLISELPQIAEADLRSNSHAFPWISSFGYPVALPFVSFCTPFGVLWRPDRYRATEPDRSWTLNNQKTRTWLSRKTLLFML